MVVGCKVKPLSCQGCCQLSTVSIPVHFDHFEALNHHFIDEPHGGNLIKADRGYKVDSLLCAIRIVRIF